MVWLRLRSLLAGLWFGAVCTLAGVSAPVAFALLDRTSAGRVAGQGFRIEAHAALGLAVLLLLIERRILASRGAGATGASSMSAELLLVLAALFCTVLGYFALQPMMEAARLGQGGYSFGVLHGASSALFALKGVLLGVLTWRCVPAPRPAA
jgi:hypothetical protein